MIMLNTYQSDPLSRSTVLSHFSHSHGMIVTCWTFETRSGCNHRVGGMQG